MLLTIDCGNTHIVFGIFHHSKLTYSWRIDTSVTNNKEHFLEIFIDCLMIFECFNWYLFDRRYSFNELSFVFLSFSMIC